MQPIVVLINAKSGVGDNGGVPGRLEALFAERNVDAKVFVFHDGGELAREARRALEQGCRTIVAGGGDGTISCVASVVAGTEAVLGVLPLGTLNHFAKDLGLPPALDAAVDVIAAGHVRAVDVGEVNGRVFINNSSVGIYPTIVAAREREQRLGKRKWSAFARAVWTVLGRYPLVRVSVSAGGVPTVRKTPIVFVGNNDYEIHGLKLGTRKRLDEGRLSVYLTRNVSRRTLVMFAVRALFGRLREHKDFDELSTTELTIRTVRKRIRVAADGEVVRMETPLEFRIRPGALNVLAPPADDGGSKAPG